MLQWMLDRGEARSVVLLYGNERRADVAYAAVLERAERELGIRTVHAFSSEAQMALDDHEGFVDAALIRRTIPDFAERIFYVSGPQAMVAALRRTLRGMGVSPFRIKVDYFPGFA
jgi:glycine betaine catabolism B